MQQSLAYTFVLAALLTQAPAKGQSAFAVKKDTVEIRNMELVIRNQTKDVQGFLLSAGNGHTRFIVPGTAMQFTAGAQGYPAPGDSIYAHTAFRRCRIMVWRNGRLQAEGTSPGVVADTVSGTITFRPAIAAGDRIHIESLQAGL